MTVIHPDTDLAYWSRENWLGHGEGFSVEDATRRLGLVEEVIGPDGEPEQLVVRGGLFANRGLKIERREDLFVEIERDAFPEAF